MRLPAKRLEIRVLRPDFHDPLVAQIIELLEDHEPDHESDGLCRAAMLAVARGEHLFESLPWNAFAQLKQRMPGVELVDEVFVKEIALVLSGWLGLHHPSQPGDIATGF